MKSPEYTRGAAKAPAPPEAELRPSRAARRRARRERCAELVAAGVRVPGRPSSHYQTADIRDAVQADIGAMRTQIEEHRDQATDSDWAYRRANAKRIRGEDDKRRRELVP